MGRRDHYRTALRGLDVRRWPAYLRENSGLPGPRGNIELAQAVADEGDLALFDRMIATDDEYLVFCAVIGLGRLLADGTNLPDSTDSADIADGTDLADSTDSADIADGTDLADSTDMPDGADLLLRLRGHAVDPRWRVREAVAMALQRLGDADLPRLLPIVMSWAADPHPLVRRAAAAAVCEPRLLTTGPAAACAIDVCSRATEGLARLPWDGRKDPGVRALRQALGYCWSVAVAADPVAGLPRFRALGDNVDRDVAWIVRENGKKARLAALL